MSDIQRQPSVRQQFESAITLHRQGRIDAAERVYTDILLRDPAHLEAMHHLGVVYAQTRRLREALPLLDRVVERMPGHAEARLHLANTLTGLMRYEQALGHFAKAVELKPDLAAATSGAGAARRLREELDRLAARAEGAGPVAASRLWSRADALRDQGLRDEALRYYDAALSAAPASAALFTNRGNVLRELGRLDEALASHDAAVAADAAVSASHSNRSIALLELGRLEESLAASDEAVRIDPSFPQAHANRGNALRHLGRLDEAIAAYAHAVALHPHFAAALANKAICHLLQGDFVTGLPLYEHRQSLRRIGAHRQYRQPRWAGESLAGRTLFIYHELYLGDMIQLCRYALLARERGARVVLSAQNVLHPLLATLPGGVELIAEDATPEAFDVHVPLLSLLLAFGTRPDTIPGGGPYLSADAMRVAHWRERIGATGFRIGIHWQGSQVSAREGRAIPLAAFAPLAAIPGVRLISLQVGYGTEQMAALQGRFAVESPGDDFDRGPHAFLDTAAAMQNLDLIISCDSAVAHLAGALGRPIWLALKSAPDWRWLLDRSDTPWYPSMRLFRQPTAGDWDSVFAAMADALRTGPLAGEGHRA